MVSATLVVVFSALVGQASGEAGPKLIAKDDAVLWHAVPIIDQSTGLLPTTMGHLITFTKIGTGEMKILATDSTTKVVIPMGIDRVQTKRTIIVGIAADKDRVYVLQGNFFTETLQGFDDRVGAAPVANRGYRLLVFRLNDGAPRQSLTLASDMAAKDPLRPNAGPGPLRLHDRGVECFGVRFEFAADGSVMKSATDRRTFTLTR